MKPECPEIPGWAWEAAASLRNAVVWQSNGANETIARALLDAHQRGKDESQAEIARLNKVIARMQQTMSSQAEQWTRSMAEAERRGMEKAAGLIDHGFDKLVGEPYRADGTPSKNDKCPHGRYMYEDCEQCCSAAIRAKAQEVKT